ncbi:MAG: 4-hydroxythreonine-4-phosphate dehydrogenase PdxA [Planctomycetota bacterium]|nr:4-hydroxythreonine-4-phosphate dehydrogenase PdxA [Planctomycetota bacterium]
MTNLAFKPTLAISMGDPTGIGPEIIAGAVKNRAVGTWCTPIVVGRTEIMRRASQAIGADIDWIACSTWDQLQPQLLDPLQESPSHRLRVLCLDAASEESEQAPAGQIDARGGQAAYDSLVAATGLCLDKKIDGIVTAPLQKKSLDLAGHPWPGHTELLGYLCGVETTAMMLYLPPGKPNHGGPSGLGVVHVTLHMALRDVFEHITVANILKTIELTHDYFSRLAKAEGRQALPRIAVTALNPHAGESGRFGTEEIDCIAPAVTAARGLGIDASGPWAVDTLMPKAAQGQFDAVVAMYHDQGHIALKLLDMFEAVNITLGLPIVRTSVAHGTAHDIAWKGIAQSGGMVQAILAAAKLCGR